MLKGELARRNALGLGIQVVHTSEVVTLEDAADQVNAKVGSELAGAVFWEVQRAASE